MYGDTTLGAHVEVEVQEIDVPIIPPHLRHTPPRDETAKIELAHTWL